ncbi:uncharacterized protein LOC142369081 isoform X1 [Odontesthes bonariensis]|uniref:uncharacterized protein LOC142369081 isoform X1 n=1 Tax=Odontesthes bonariensis TaxID=219752 RepID=UPI003F589904
MLKYLRLCPQAEGLSPSERFTTTYNSDFKPIPEHQPQLKPTTEAQSAPAFISPSQADRETWPVFFQHFYKTTNNVYGSTVGSQPPSGCLSPAFLPPFGVLTPSFSMAVGGAGSTLKDARMQGANFPRETGLSFGEEDEAVVLKQLQSKVDSHWKTDYVEGLILLSPYGGPTCCEDLLRSLPGEVRPPHQLNPPVASCPVFTSIHNKDADNFKNSTYLWGLSPAVGPPSNTCLQPTSSRCSYCAWETEHPVGGRFETQTIPCHICRSSIQPLARAQVPDNCTEPSKKSQLTEYQARYAAEVEMGKTGGQSLCVHGFNVLIYPAFILCISAQWGQPKIQ